MSERELSAVMRALNLVERIRKDGAEGWEASWRREAEPELVAQLTSLIVSFLLENDAQRRDMTWDEIFDQLRQEAVEHMS
ncbi:hypothetical protein [Streptomyces sp. NPDC053542]|uniref:hypothetical protein n=1 Tax=Streptomyces sp. NPDC053542 TaxID=3365710 RepID=UPI0037D3EC5B